MPHTDTDATDCLSGLSKVLYVPTGAFCPEAKPARGIASSLTCILAPFLTRKVALILRVKLPGYGVNQPLGPQWCRPTNQCTRIAMQRLIEIDWACGGVFALKVALLTRNRVISSVSPLVGNCTRIRTTR
jgi:hypothetical protein